MIREVDLVSYLPPFLKEFKENTITLEAENPEFTLMWKVTDWVLYNEFVETADEYGLSRFEKLLGIFPSKEDTMDDRRFRILARYNENVPYTRKSLVSMLELLCGKNGYQLIIDTSNFLVTVKVALTAKNQVESIQKLLERILPCNMKFSIELLYNTWEKMKPYTWNMLASFSWKQIKEEEEVLS
ncbi:MAG: DUF2313 domain-containing protein [Clostridiales bacterium]|nr:DUF2313 domain-containing protein [Clostridiales bacterium]